MTDFTHTALHADDFCNAAPVAVAAEQYKHALCAAMQEAVDKLNLPDFHAPVESITITATSKGGTHRVKLLPVSPGCARLEVQQ